MTVPSDRDAAVSDDGGIPCERGVIRVDLVSASAAEVPERIEDFLAWIAAHREIAPAECRDDLRLSMEDGRLGLFVLRLETDGEMALRAVRNAMERAAQDEAARALFLKLKARFEPAA